MNKIYKVLVELGRRYFLLTIINVSFTNVHVEYSISEKVNSKINSVPPWMSDENASLINEEVPSKFSRVRSFLKLSLYGIIPLTLLVAVLIVVLVVGYVAKFHHRHLIYI